MDKNLAIPVIDALTNDNIDGQSLGFHAQLTLLKESLRRDLLNLFNTRQAPVALFDQSSCLSESMINYGLPDLMSINLNSKSECGELCTSIKKAILTFEPRVSDVVVSVKGLPDPLEPEFYFRIEMTLNLALEDELIIFDSAMDPVNQRVSVKEVAFYEQ